MVIPTVLTNTYSIIDTLTTTRKSTVYLVQKPDNKPLVCKQVNKREHRVDIRNELSVLTRMKGNQRIVQLDHKMEDDDHVYLFLEYCSKGTLSSVYGKANIKDEQVVRDIIKKSIVCLLECHKKRLIHGDVKFNNFVVNDADITKLIDFGCSRYVEDEFQVLDFKTGTPFHMAPENIEGKQCMRSDVWGLGVSIYHFLTNQHPFAKVTDFSESLWNSILNHDMNTEIIEGYNGKLKDLMKKMLEKDPVKRISLEDAYTHPFLQS